MVVTVVVLPAATLTFGVDVLSDFIAVVVAVGVEEVLVLVFVSELPADSDVVALASPVEETW